MELQFGSRGILKCYRPYIDQEESGRKFAIYQPEQGGPNYGLYTQYVYDYCPKNYYFFDYDRKCNEKLTYYPYKKFYQ